MRPIISHFIFLLILTLSAPAFAAASEKLVGGNCSYESFSGTCSIESVDRRAKVSFFSFEGEVRGNQVSFGGNMVEKTMRKGMRAPCMLKVMKSGTCTPCMIEGEKISGACGGEGYSALFRKKR